MFNEGTILHSDPLPMMMGHYDMLKKARAIIFTDSKLIKGKTKKWIGWSTPCENSMKLNMDGTVKGKNGVVGCGGLIRDHQGNFLGGFLYNDWSLFGVAF